MIKPQDILVLVKLISIENQHQIFKEYYSEAQLEWDKLEDEQLDIFLKLSAFYDSLSIRGLAEAVVISKNKGLGLVSALAVGAGVAAVAAGKKYKTAETKKKEDYDALHNTSEYRNTERGKYEKNSKGIYYTNGNYEAFARPRKPEGVDDKHAYIVGSGLASLAAACFLVRDGQMPGKNIHILEAMDIAGGACDGIFDPSRGYVMRGGREMENHFECLWDLFRSIPSIETPDVSVLDEYYWLNKEDPNYSLCRATKERGKDAHTDGKFNLSQKGCMEIMKLFMTKDEDLYDKTIEDVFDEEVFDSTFWLY